MRRPPRLARSPERDVFPERPHVRPSSGRRVRPRAAECAAGRRRRRPHLPPRRRATSPPPTGHLTSSSPPSRNRATSTASSSASSSVVAGERRRQVERCSRALPPGERRRRRRGARGGPTLVGASVAQRTWPSGAPTRRGRRWRRRSASSTRRRATASAPAPRGSSTRPTSPCTTTTRRTRTTSSPTNSSSRRWARRRRCWIELLQGLSDVPAAALSQAEATLVALGIHADTGALAFPSTTPRDGAALVWLMTQGPRSRRSPEFGRARLAQAQRDVLTQGALGVGRHGAPRPQGLASSPSTPAAASSRRRRLRPNGEVVRRRLLGVVARPVAAGGTPSSDTVAPLPRGAGRRDLNTLMSSFGGGGHPAAAAASVRLTVEGECHFRGTGRGEGEEHELSEDDARGGGRRRRGLTPPPRPGGTPDAPPLRTSGEHSLQRDASSPLTARLSPPASL